MVSIICETHIEGGIKNGSKQFLQFACQSYQEDKTNLLGQSKLEGKATMLQKEANFGGNNTQQIRGGYK